MQILNWLKGYKTFIIGICAIVWGIHTSDTNLIYTGLATMGLRQAIATSTNTVQ